MKPAAPAPIVTTSLEEQQLVQRDRRRQKIAAGVCIDCDDKAVPGKRRCDRHLAANRKSAAKKDADYERAVAGTLDYQLMPRPLKPPGRS